MRGCDDADIHRDRVAGPDAFKRLLLDGPQQLGLDFQTDIADLVQEQGPAVGELEAADLVAMGAGESPLTWPNNSLSNSPGERAAQWTFT